ncbi:unnamed protein product [Sympodiomycopsis kandeliae]
MASASRVVRLHPKNTALFVCDLQERFASAIHSWEHVIKTSHKVLKAAQILQVPVYATEQAPKALGATVTPLSSIISTLPPPSTTQPLAKTRFSMYLPDHTSQWLQEAKIKSVIIVGIESHVCVLQTTLDLLEKGYDVHILADAVSSCNAGERKIALERMRQAGAQITSSESILFQLLEDASHPNFKAVSALIKEEKQTTKEATEELLGKL